MTHSELNGEYDSLAVNLANNLELIDFASVNDGPGSRAVIVNVLVYRIADGTLTLSFRELRRRRWKQVHYYGAAWTAVEKANHLWITIEPNGYFESQRRPPRSYHRRRL